MANFCTLIVISKATLEHATDSQRTATRAKVMETKLWQFDKKNKNRIVQRQIRGSGSTVWLCEISIAYWVYDDFENKIQSLERISMDRR